ncbi:MAG TPA: riboflavin kinase [Candidatus Gracilibacteria bacterium]|nr:riboflavin kinase [Candidatus Gracilibacteria bacterium]
MKKVAALVVRGNGRGHELGFPTINLEVEPENLKNFTEGVYACLVKVKGRDYMGAASFGAQPTFGSKEKKMEIFLIGFSGDLYGEKVEVQVYNRLREVRRFSTPDELKRQIEDDVQQVVKVLQKIKIL